MSSRRRFATPIPLKQNTTVARAEGYTCAMEVRALCLVQGPFSVNPCRTLLVRFAQLFG
jgi:hypothetical protein